jgi:hypothetical protein
MTVFETSYYLVLNVVFQRFRECYEKNASFLLDD